MKLEKLRELLISYAGLTLQEPEMFPQPQEYVVHLRGPLMHLNVVPDV